jgi:hypothetical protein
MHFGLDPDATIDWVIGRPDVGSDLTIGRTKIDVKPVDLHDQFLICRCARRTSSTARTSMSCWPFTLGRHGECRGWTGKQTFKRRCRMAVRRIH